MNGEPSRRLHTIISTEGEIRFQALTSSGLSRNALALPLLSFEVAERLQD